jgi:hypothetical protein
MGEFREGGFNPSQEEEKDGLTAEQRELAEYYSARYADSPKVELRDVNTEIAEVEGMFRDFEARYSLEQLHAITDLAAEEAPNHPLRGPAQEALDPIVAKLTDLKDRIPAEQYAEVYNKYQRLSKAVGLMSNNKVRHEW